MIYLSSSTKQQGQNTDSCVLFFLKQEKHYFFKRWELKKNPLILIYQNLQLKDIASN